MVAINGKGEMICGYRNVQEAARINHSHPVSIYYALKNRTFHHKHLWMWEEDYRPYWFEGRTAELANSFWEFRSKAVKKGHGRMNEERKLQWKRNLSRTKKQKLRDKLVSMPEHKTRLLCVTTGEVFESMTAFARKYNVTPSAVSHAAKTGQKVSKKVVTKITEKEYEKRRNQKETD